MTLDLTMFYTTDEEGNEVELPRPETKSWSDVIQVLNHWHEEPAGNPVIDRFIAMYFANVQWNWFESYKQWQQDVLTIEEINANQQPDEEGNLPDPLPFPEMPKQPVLETNDNLLHKALGKIYQQFEEIIKWQQIVKNSYKADQPLVSTS